MIGVTLRSMLRHRGATVASMLICGIGIVLVAAMAGVLASGLAPQTRPEDQAFLTQFPAILGGWVVAIVVFAVISTVSVAVEGRATEIRALRLAGAAPGQIQRMLTIEAGVAAVSAAVPGVPISYALGGLMVGMIAERGLIAAPSGFHPGVGLPLIGALVVIMAAAAGGYVGSRQAAHAPLAGAAPRGRGRGRRGRRTMAVVMLVVGLGLSASALATDPHQVYGTAMTGPGCVLVAVGLAALATEFVSAGNLLLKLAARSNRSASLHLAVINLRTAPDRARPIVTFLTLFIGVAGGTLTMQAIENTASSQRNGLEATLAGINYLVVGLIAAFMAIGLINNILAALGRRRPELRTMSLIGATASQSSRMILIETAAAVIISSAIGILGAICVVAPFAVLKTGRVWAAFAPASYAAVAVAGAIIVLGVSYLASPGGHRSAVR